MRIATTTKDRENYGCWIHSGMVGLSLVRPREDFCFLLLHHHPPWFALVSFARLGHFGPGDSSRRTSRFGGSDVALLPGVDNRRFAGRLVVLRQFNGRHFFMIADDGRWDSGGSIAHTKCGHQGDKQDGECRVGLHLDLQVGTSILVLYLASFC